MARKGTPIGLDDLYYAPITEAATASTGVAIGDETYGSPVKLAEAISAQLSVELAEAILYADDKASEVVKEFKQAKLSLKVKDVGPTVCAALCGATVDSNGVLVSTGEDVAKPVAVGFRARKSNGKYRYIWLYRVTFGIAGAEYQTKGDGVNFANPTIEGIAVRRNKADEATKHPWKAEVDEDDDSISATNISGWFTSVYEPDYPASAG